MEIKNCLITELNNDKFCAKYNYGDRKNSEGNIQNVIDKFDHFLVDFTLI